MTQYYILESFDESLNIWTYAEKCAYASFELAMLAKENLENIDEDNGIDKLYEITSISDHEVPSEFEIYE